MLEKTKSPMKKARDRMFNLLKETEKMIKRSKKEKKTKRWLRKLGF